MAIQFSHNEHGPPATLNVKGAKLPDTYENARNALVTCERLDECKDWSDKAAALASYARMADDDELHKMAVRIKSRAIRRAGELLKQIEPATGKNNQYAKVKGEGDQPFHSRQTAASEAGLSSHQAKQAVRVANVPEKEFDEQVESSKPPTVSALAKQGTQPRQRIDPETWLKGRSPADYNLVLHFVADVESYAERCGDFDVERLTKILTDEDRQKLRVAINAIDKVHDALITRI